MEVTLTEKTKALVDRAVELKRQEKQAKEEYNSTVAELHEICERILQDRGVKSSIVYGSPGNSAVITSPVKVSVVSYEKLIDAIGERLINEFAPVKIVQPEREPTKGFTQVMADVVLGNYLEGDLESFLTETFKPNSQQKGILMKKLKGVYDKDRQVLINMFGMADYDVELYHISKIMAYERIKRHLPSNLTEIFKAVKEAVAVDEGIRTEVIYQDE